MEKSAPFVLFDIPIANITMQQALEEIEKSIDAYKNRPEDPCSVIHFVNAHCMNISTKDALYKEILQQANIIFADGSGINMAAKKFGIQLADNVNGTDMFPLLCKQFAASGKKLYLLGAAPGIAEKTGLWANEYAQKQVVAGWRDGFFTVDETPAVIADIIASKADLLLVAMGVPKQEHWIHTWHSQLSIPLAMGVGGLFDFYSGNIPRAPKWMRKMGIEWVWRLLMEPGRMWKRYIVGNIAFVIRVNRYKREQKS